MNFYQLVFGICFLTLCSCNQIDGKKELEAGMDQFNNELYAEAISTLSKVIDATDTCDRCYEYRSHSYKMLKKYDQAMNDMEWLIEREPENAALYANRASLFYMKGKYLLALSDFEKALALKSDFVDMYNPMAHMLFITGDKPTACIYYSKALEVGENSFNEEIIHYCEKQTHL